MHASQQPFVSSNSSDEDQSRDSLHEDCNEGFKKPKRPLSAYNLFFQHERRVILEGITSDPQASHPGSKPRRSHGKIGFAALARTIAAKWKTIDEATLAHYEQLVMQQKKVYNEKMRRFKAQRAPIIEHIKPTTSDHCSLQLPSSLRQMIVCNMNTGTNSIFQSPQPVEQIARNESMRSSDDFLNSIIMDDIFSLDGPTLSPSPLTRRIGELARKLDNDSIDFLVESFSMRGNWIE